MTAETTINTSFNFDHNQYLQVIVQRKKKKNKVTIFGTHLLNNTRGFNNVPRKSEE